MHVPNFGGLSGSEEMVGVTTVSNSLIKGREGDKSFKEWRQKIGDEGVGDNNILTFSSYCTR